ncbi:MAG TPA: peptidylprolyl isomerase [Gaiellaceae bacterium]|nr:peptidylprolyl isomerase [Gaiellaceae bacterium]
MKTRLLPFLSVSVALVAVLAACGGGGGSSSVPPNAVATVGSATISKATFNQLMSVGCAHFKAQGQPCPKPGTVTYGQLRDQAISFLVQTNELQQEAQKMGVTVTQQEVDKQVATIKKTYYKGNTKAFNEALKKDQITLAQLEQFNIRPNLLNSKLEAKVTSSIKVSNSAAMKYYDQNKSAFTQPETREVRHILVNSKSLADRLYQQLKHDNGSNFAQLAKRYSKDTASAAHGGKLCVAHNGTSGNCQPTVTPFDKVAFSLKTNGISAPVKSQYGWHIIQALTPVKPAHTQTFNEVKTQIEQNLSSQQRQTAWQNWLAKVTDDFKGKVSYQTGYAPSTTTTPTVSTPTVSTTG